MNIKKRSDASNFLLEEKVGKENRKFLLVVFLVFAIVLFLPFVFAIPQDFNVNGRLTDASGNSLVGTYNVLFSIYNVEVGGTALWSSTIPVTTNALGVFNSRLTNINLDFKEQYYLGVKILGGSDNEMSPRIILSSAGYSLRTKNISISGIEWDANADAGGKNITNLGSVGIGIGTATPLAKLQVNGNVIIGYANLTFDNHQSEQFIKSSANGGAIRLRSNSVASTDRNVQFGNVDNYGAWSSYMTVADGGNVGIGTTNPTDNLAVVSPSSSNWATVTVNVSKIGATGSAYFGTLSDNGNYVRMETAASGSALSGLTPGSSVIWASKNLSFATNGVRTPVMLLTTVGNVGIGTTAPVQKLNVIGNGNFTGTVYINGNIDLSTKLGSGLTSTGSANYVPVFSSPTAIANSVIYQNGNNIGIGTTNPSNKLDLVDSSAANLSMRIYHSSSALTANYYPSIILAQNPIGQSYINNISLKSVPHSLGNYPAFAITTQRGIVDTTEYTRFFIDGFTGNVGIGTTTPSSLLTTAKVAGTNEINLSGVVYVNSTSGEVGIGTTTPSRTLDVRGIGNFSGTIYIDNATDIKTLISSGITGSGTANRIPRFTSATAIGDSEIYQNGNNIGIGTTTANTKLEVNGDVMIGYNNLQLMPAGGSVATDSDAGIYWHTPGTGAGADYGIYRTPGAWTGNTFQQLKLHWGTGIVLDPGTLYGKSYVDIVGGGLRVTQGNVGIGTTATSGKLTILQDSTANTIPAIRIIGSAGDPTNYRLDIVPSLNTEVDYRFNLKNAYGTAFDGTVMTFRGNGNVGIGTTAPGAKLTVSGSSLATGTNIYGVWTPDGNSLVRNWNINDGDSNWNLGSATIVNIVDGPIGSYVIRSPTNAYTEVKSMNWIPIDVNKTYRVSVWVRGGGSVIPDLNYISIRQTDAAFYCGALNNNCWGAPYFYYGAITTSWVKYETTIGKNGVYSFNSGTKYFQVGMLMNYPHGTPVPYPDNGYAEFQGFRVEELPDNLDIITNGLRVNATGPHYIVGGNVGIGTASPGAKLEVTPSSVAWSEGIAINPSTSNYDAIFFRATAGSTTNSWSLGKLPNNNLAVLRNGLTGMTGTSRVDAAMEINTNNGATVFGGNVGIGTTNPTGQLTVRKDAANTLGPIMTINNEGGGPGSAGAIDFYTYAPQGLPPEARILATDVGGFTASLNFLTKLQGSGSNALTSRMYIDSIAGNVGIGTTAPDTKLEVVSVDSDTGLSNNYGTLRLSSATPQLEFVDSDNNDWAIHANSNKLYFIRQPWNVDDLVLDGTGNVGIGTASPTQKLEVSNSAQGLTIAPPASAGGSAVISTTGAGTSVTITSSGGSVYVKLGA